MNENELINLLKAETETAPAFAQERVWRKIASRKSRRSASWRFIAAASLVLNVCLAGWFVSRSTTPAAQPVAERFEHAVLLPEAGAQFTGGTNGTLTSGRVLISTWGEPISIRAGSHQITAEAAVFSLQIAGDSVQLSVSQGIVSFDGQRVEPRAAAKALAAVVALEPPEAASVRAHILERTTLGTEAALLAVGQRQLWADHDFEAATSTFRSMLAQFPRSALREDAELSLVEALVSANQWSDAHRHAQLFITTYPSSERLAEMTFIGAVAQQNLGRQREACGQLHQVKREALSATHYPAFDTLTQRCTSFERTSSLKPFGAP